MRRKRQVRRERGGGKNQEETVSEGRRDKR